jgi:hypothetical protein
MCVCEYTMDKYSGLSQWLQRISENEPEVHSKVAEMQREFKRFNKVYPKA